VSTAIYSTDQAAGSGSAADADARRQPVHAIGQGAMWVYIVGDLFIFGGWFVFYLVYRAMQPLHFLESQAQLSQTIGVINTLILLISSFWVALCVNATRAGRYDQATRYAWLTILSGALFGASKVYEWMTEVAAGHTFTSNYFFMFYFFLTAIHLFHVMCGFIVLGVLVRHLRDPALRSQVVIENCAAFWHLVDVLWVVIFALLYLLR
jgi:nitric oxide reductase NorE protein